MLAKVISTFCCLAMATATSAACPDMSDAQPARLIDDEQQKETVAGLVSKWKSDEPVRLIKFGAYVTKTGGLESECCVSSTHRMSSGAHRRLAANLARLRFTPATHQGEPLRVYVGFSIVARKSPDGVNTVLLMNQLHSMNAFGMTYSAPQRVWYGSIWPEGRFTGSVYIEVNASVDARGQASDAAVNKQESTSSSKATTFAARIESACFVPGFHDGKPTEMLYAEAFAPL